MEQKAQGVEQVKRIKEACELANDYQDFPLVSVIIPVYNVEKYLEDCIKSIQVQTLNQIEIICVNDGSSDSSLEILNRLANDDPRIVVINQENTGAGAARNNGVSIARGKYIGFVDSDDLIYPTMYEELYSKASCTNADLVITGEIETFFNENIYFPLKGSWIKPEQLELSTFSAIEYPEILQNVFLWNRLYLRSFWISNNLNIPEGRRFAEDMLICTQTSCLAKRIAYVRGPLYKYRNVRENSLSDTLAKSKQKMDYLTAVSETKSFLKKTGAYQFYVTDFLTFSVSIFLLLQKRVTNLEYYTKFYNGMSDILEKSDFEKIKKTWLVHAYPCEIKALEDKNPRKVFYRNALKRIFHI